MILILQIALGMLLGFFLIQHYKTIISWAGSIITWSFILILIVGTGIAGYSLYKNYLVNNEILNASIKDAAVILVFIGILAIYNITLLFSRSIENGVFKKYATIQIEISKEESLRLFPYFISMLVLSYFVVVFFIIPIDTTFTSGNDKLMFVSIFLAIDLIVSIYFYHNNKHLFPKRFLLNSALIIVSAAIFLALITAHI